MDSKWQRVRLAGLDAKTGASVARMYDATRGEIGRPSKRSGGWIMADHSERLIGVGLFAFGKVEGVGIQRAKKYFLFQKTARETFVRGRSYL